MVHTRSGTSSQVKLVSAPLRVHERRWSGASSPAQMPAPAVPWSRGALGQSAAMSDKIGATVHHAPLQPPSNHRPVQQTSVAIGLSQSNVCSLSCRCPVCLLTCLLT